MDAFFMLFANCIITKGTSRAIISDLQRKRYKPIPLLLLDVMDLLCSQKKSIIWVKEQFEHEYDEGIDLFLADLERDGYGIKTNDIDLFSKMPMDYDYPAKLTNAILDFDSNLQYKVDNLAKELDLLGCQALEVRFFHTPSINEVISILKPFDLTGIRTIDLLIKYSDDWNIDNFMEVFVAQRRLSKVIIHTAPIDQKIEHEYLSIFHINKAIPSSKCCGQVHLRYFNLDLKHFTESQQHNTCLNRKISIDSQGNIKNCPSMSQSFGHISTTSLEEVIANPEFTKWWHLKKDDIDKCKGCEFRHICTDCRAYLENPNDIYSAPLKCGYNPETCEWEDWSTNPLKQKAIQHYELDLILENN